MAVISDPPAEGTLTLVEFDDRTPDGLYLPHEKNNARMDVRRIRASLIKIYQAFEGLIDEDAIKGLIDDAITNLIGGAPEMLNALNELAAAIGNDPNFAVTIAGQLADINAALADTYRKSQTFTKTEVQNLLAEERKMTAQKHYWSLM